MPTENNETQVAGPEQQAEHEKPFYTTVTKGSPEFWEEHGEVLTDLYKKVYDPIYEQNGLSKEEIDRIIENGSAFMEFSMINPDSLIVLLHDKNSKGVIGYTYAFPAIEDENSIRAYVKDTGFLEGNNDVESMKQIRDNALEVGITLVDPAYQQRGGWSMMRDALNDSLQKDQSTPPYLLRYVRKENDYADKVAEAPGGTIEYAADYDSRLYGPQKFYRVRLQKPER